MQTFKNEIICNSLQLEDQLVDHCGLKRISMFTKSILFVEIQAQSIISTLITLVSTINVILMCTLFIIWLEICMLKLTWSI
jgi:hypothetical protein